MKKLTGNANIIIPNIAAKDPIHFPKVKKQKCKNAIFNLFLALKLHLKSKLDT